MLSSIDDCIEMIKISQPRLERSNLNSSKLTFRNISDDFVKGFVSEHPNVCVDIVTQSKKHVHRRAQVLRKLRR